MLPTPSKFQIFSPGGVLREFGELGAEMPGVIEFKDRPPRKGASGAPPKKT